MKEMNGFFNNVNLRFLPIGISLVFSVFSGNVSKAQPKLFEKAPASQWVFYNNAGKLQYKPDELGNVIPDFSGVGYKKGAVALPNPEDVPAVVELSAPASGDATALIQEALDRVGKMPRSFHGYRGAVLLKKGTYQVASTIYIRHSGVILRGEGDDETGTILIGTTRKQYPLIVVDGTGKLTERKGTCVALAAQFFPTGTKTIRLASAPGFKVGQSIVLERPGTDAWIRDLKMNQIIEREGTKQWEAKDYTLRFERVVEAIKGNEITLDYPLMMPFQKEYGGGQVFAADFEGRISEVGVEDLLLKSEYASDTDEQHCWDGVKLFRVRDAFVRRITAMHFGHSAVDLGRESRNITVTDCKSLDPKSIITGGRRYSFNNDGQFSIVQNCYASFGRHDYVSGARTMGPNVFYNCKSVNAQSDIGPHHRWSAGTLYDNIQGDGEINFQDRGNYGSGHGWSGTTQVLWNSSSKKASVQNPWVSGKNYAIGYTGEKYSGRFNDKPDGVWEHPQKRVHPASLYIAQCNDRMQELARKMPTKNWETWAWNHTAAQTEVLKKNSDVLVSNDTITGGNKRISPRTIDHGALRMVRSGDWTSGFFPGMLWYLYEYSGKSNWKEWAKEYTKYIEREQWNGGTHDMGFKIYCSVGNGFRNTGDTGYKRVLLQSAKTLITRYNVAVGAIRSWDHNSDKWKFPVIIDNMMNLELLFEATRLSGDSVFHQVAVNHANTTLKNHFRADASSYHVIGYNPETGKVEKKNTHQGYAHESAWARGQAWGLYGYTMCYRYTRNPIYLEQANKIAAYIFHHPNMPADLIPYWDFDAPNIPAEPRDVSAAAVIASALYELQTYTTPELRKTYLEKANQMLLNMHQFFGANQGQSKGFTLLSSVGSKMSKSEVAVPIVYAEYYYIEALLRKKKWEERKNVVLIMVDDLNDWVDLKKKFQN